MQKNKDRGRENKKQKLQNCLKSGELFSNLEDDSKHSNTTNRLMDISRMCFNPVHASSRPESPSRCHTVCVFFRFNYYDSCIMNMF